MLRTYTYTCTLEHRVICAHSPTHSASPETAHGEAAFINSVITHLNANDKIRFWCLKLFLGCFKMFILKGSGTCVLCGLVRCLTAGRSPSSAASSHWCCQSWWAWWWWWWWRWWGWCGLLWATAGGGASETPGEVAARMKVFSDCAVKGGSGCLYRLSEISSRNGKWNRRKPSKPLSKYFFGNWTGKSSFRIIRHVWKGTWNNKKKPWRWKRPK